MSDETHTITLRITLGELTDLYRYGPLRRGHVLLSDAWNTAGGGHLVDPDHAEQIRREDDERSAA